jgi:hypothetical protein
MEGFRLLFELVFLILRTAGSCGRGFARLILSSRSHSWPVTNALIQAVECTDDVGVYCVRVAYEYSVNQQYYAGTLLHESFSKHLAARWAMRFTPRAYYLVRYDPNHPARSFLPSTPTLTQTAAIARF